jgi:hypothetical protein
LKRLGDGSAPRAQQSQAQRKADTLHNLSRNNGNG